MDTLNAIHVEIAAVASSVSGMRGASAWEVNTIPATPYAVVGMSKAKVTPGDRNVTELEFPMRLYFERLADAARDAQATNSMVHDYQVAFASNGGLKGTVTHAYISAWDADVFYAIGGALYAAVDFTVTATVHEHMPQSLGY